MVGGMQRDYTTQRGEEDEECLRTNVVRSPFPRSWPIFEFSGIFPFTTFVQAPMRCIFVRVYVRHVKVSHYFLGTLEHRADSGEVRAPSAEEGVHKSLPQAYT